MDRRKSLKLIATGAIAGGAVAIGCKTEEKKEVKATEPEFAIDRYGEEKAYEKTLIDSKRFFNEHEMATITILADIIIPRDEISGSASEAGVPEFIEFIVKDMPAHQLPMQGGLRWLDLTCLKLHEKSFLDCTEQERLSLIDRIAYPEKVPAGLEQGARFFSLMRNLTATGFYTSKTGIADIGYAGNQPNRWNGVPDEVLKQYNISYSQKDLDDCVSFA